jgi:signal transduction histidine kinase/CheY-like chemotaxis protein
VAQEEFTIHFGWLAITAASGALLFMLLSMRIAFYARERRAESERRAASEALRAAAESANRTKDLFLATLSHELRGPLSAVIGWTDVARSYLDDPRELERCLDIVLRNAKQEARIIDDLLDVSSILSGKFSVVLAPVALSGVVHEGIEACRTVADEKGVVLRAQVDAGLSVSGDRRRLLQVLHNLIGNAIKFNAPGGWVRVTLKRADARARIVVADNGAGIEKEALEHVFERFWQSERKSGGGYAGLGLGLAIVHHIVALHGGRITAESRGPGNGAAFAVELPLLAAQPAESRDDMPVAAPGDPTLAGLAVVAVDDDRDTREWLERLLRRHGAHVWLASSADEAEALCARVSPDLLVSDIAMPGRDGYDLVRALRAQPGGRPLGALALSAQASEEDREHALDAGYDVFQPKPCEGGKLVGALQRLAAKRAAPARAEAP